MARSDTKYAHELEVACEAVARAAEIANSSFQSVLEMSVKGAKSDIVTNIDIACELEMIRLIKHAFPTHSIVVEETEGHNIGGSSWRWIIDPLDGTNNYAIALPIFGVSIALYYERTPILACLAEGLRESLIAAVAGKGVTIGRAPLTSPRNGRQAPSGLVTKSIALGTSVSALFLRYPA